MIFGCDSASDIVVLELSCANNQSLDQAQLVHVDFNNNNVSNSGGLINGRGASCTRLSLEDAEFNQNSCDGKGCISLSSNSILRDIRVFGNRKANGSQASCSMFSFQEGSQAYVRNMSAVRNEIRIVHAQNTVVTIQFSHFRGNMREQASTRGAKRVNGGVLLASHSVLFIHNSTWQDNFASSGGAIYATASEVEIRNCSFHRNNASNDQGGAVYSSGGNPLNITFTVFSENTADRGGAFVFQSVNVSLTNCQFTKNEASHVGVGMIQHNSSFAVEEVLFDDNHACKGYTGALFLGSRSTGQIRSSVFKNNRAIGNGGAVTVIVRCRVHITDVMFTNNTSTQEGGAILASTYARVTLLKTNFSSV